MAIIWSLFSLWLVLSRAEGSILDPLQGRDESENTSLAPTTTPGDVWTDSQGLYPYLSPGTLPLIIGEVGNFQDGLQKSTGWLVARDSPTPVVIQTTQFVATQASNVVQQDTSVLRILDAVELDWSDVDPVCNFAATFIPLLNVQKTVAQQVRHVVTELPVAALVITASRDDASTLN
ncbi:hypothetical protein FRB91_010996 [Serendipita sp. 411]|nr:hypothetical protein FRB91_010996 [Serendipita sp. 411]